MNNEQVQKEASLVKQLKALSALTEIATIATIDPKETLRLALVVGREYLGLTFAIVSKIENEKYIIKVQSAPEDTLDDDMQFKLGTTYCSITLDADEVVYIDNMGKSKYAEYPCFEAFNLASYIGAPIKVSGNLYGTINFSSAEPRKDKFNEIEIEFVKLVAKWAGTYLEKQESLEQLRGLNEAIAEQHDELLQYIQTIDKYVITSATDLKGRITYVSQAFCDISGFSREELMGKNHNIVRHPEMPDSLYKNLWRTITQGKIWSGEIKNLKKNGDFYWVDVHIEPLFDKDAKIIGYRAIRQDITDKKEVEKLSVTDRLTGLYNRLKLDDVFSYEIDQVKRYRNQFSIILLDIDHFKSVNDTFGHQIGDVVLKEVSSILLKLVRKSDTLGRWGGEEFLIIASNTNAQGARELAEKFRNAIDKFTFSEVKHKTASFGVTTYKPGDSVEDMVKRADEALYKAKDNGRNRTEIM